MKLRQFGKREEIIGILSCVVVAIATISVNALYFKKDETRSKTL
jgi:hypothetical protein